MIAKIVRMSATAALERTELVRVPRCPKCSCNLKKVGSPVRMNVKKNNGTRMTAPELVKRSGTLSPILARTKKKGTKKLHLTVLSPRRADLSGERSPTMTLVMNVFKTPLVLMRLVRMIRATTIVNDKCTLTRAADPPNPERVGKN